jgi:ferredoxin/flavodoxin---NADP+ reductase
MATITEKRQLSEHVYKLTLRAPEIAAKHKAGQFVILRVSDKGERIPLTIADSDASAGTIDLIVQAVGKSTKMLVSHEAGEEILDLVGPLGVPTHLKDAEHVVMIGGGVGGAPLYPICKAYKARGTRITVILGARNESLLVLEDEFSKLADRMIIATDDGSRGMKGLVTDALQQIIDSGDRVDEVVAIGPLIMMKFVTLLTKKYDLPTTVSLNPLMVDGTGMCGGCRVKVGGVMRFACVHGPEFDGLQVDFDSLLKRAGTYKHEEKCKLDAYVEGDGK